MKFIFSISLRLILLFVFTTVTTTSLCACEKKIHQKEVQTQKHQCKKDCCKKSCGNSKNKKKNCCDDGCSCSVSIVVMADLPEPITINKVRLRLPLFVKSIFFYEQTLQKSSVQDIWQPPINVLFNS